MSNVWFNGFQELQKKGIPFVLATIVKGDGSAPREVGTKMIVYEDHHNRQKIFDTIGGGNLEFRVIADAIKVLREKQSKTITYHLDNEADQVCGGVVEVFLELVSPKARLYVFGAGHVGAALARVLHDSPFEVHLIDEREEWVLSPNLPKSVVSHHDEWQDFVNDPVQWQNPESIYVAIMTHDHKHDRHILSALADRPLRYIGLMGSSNKWALFQKEMREHGAKDGDIAKVRCPIGSKKLGRGPTEIAIGIACEILSELHQ